MLFKNNGETCKIRIGDLNKCVWKNIENGEIIDLEEFLGRKFGFQKVRTTQIEINKKPAETKQIDNSVAEDLFFTELTKIKGIGVSTAQDIVVWGTKEKLIEYIKAEKHLPFRDDVAEKLRREYGKK